jgi:hypothetical protein
VFQPHIDCPLQHTVRSAIVSAYLRLSVVGAYVIRAILMRYTVGIGTDGLRGAGLLQEIVKTLKYKDRKKAVGDYMEKQ